jgi:hypothetical protein
MNDDMIELLAIGHALAPGAHANDRRGQRASLSERFRLGRAPHRSARRSHHGSFGKIKKNYPERTHDGSAVSADSGSRVHANRVRFSHPGCPEAGTRNHGKGDQRCDGHAIGCRPLAVLTTVMP